MVKKKGTPILFALLGASLSSCAPTGIYSLYVNPALNNADFVKVVGPGYYRPTSFKSLSSLDRPSIEASLQSVYSFGAKRRLIPSIGRQKITVIPVDFAAYPGQNLGEGAIDNIRKAFFGDRNGNQFYSVKEYYDKASFHRFQLEGEVAPRFFRPSRSYEYLAALPNANRTKAALAEIYQEGFQWYNQTFPETPLSEGDPIFFVYSAPYSGMDGGVSDRGNMMWAFVINDPAPIGWSSYHMLHEDREGRVDAHTNIHEFGHMLGLVDYYDTDSVTDPSFCSPLGRMDMMDCSFGDHDAFSKLLLGWTRPHVVTDNGKITLRQGEGNGDCILLTNNWNGTPFDEYLLLELYTPSYLNAFDAKASRSDGSRLMGRPGVKVYHVDARLGIYSDRTKNPLSYLEGNSLGGYSLDFHQNNNGRLQGESVHPKRDGFLVRNLPLDGSRGTPAYFIASDRDADVAMEGGFTLRYRDVLFPAGKSFVDAGYESFAFNGKGALLYDFKIEELTSTQATISFAKKA